MRRKNRVVGSRSSNVLIEQLEDRQLLAASPLHVEGNRVVNGVSETVRLAGANVPSLVWQNVGDRIQESIAAMIDTWHANTIRLPLSQDRWFGYASGQTDGGAAYRAQVDNAVAAVASRNAYVLLDLHWSDMGVWGQSPNQYRMPDNNSTTFWSNVATRYANHASVLFDLYNEPHDVNWNTWKNGGSVPDSTTFQTPGMQSLLNTVRATGATNIVVAGGLDWGYDLSGVLNGYALSDPTGNLMYGAHVYPFKGNWAYNFGEVAKQYPVFIGEFGQGSYGESEPQFDAPTTWTPRLLDYLDARGIGWTAWSTYTTTTPHLITDWNFTPTTWGQQVKDRLASYLTTNNSQPLWGPTIGTTGSYSNPNSGVYTGGSAANSVFDGDLNTFFDAPPASWHTAWVGQDLGSARQITKIAFSPRSGFASRMTGGIFQGSNTADFSSGVVNLYTVPSTPPAGWQSVAVTNAGTYRYVRYLTPTGGGANVAEIMFYGAEPALPVAIPVQDGSFESPVAGDGGAVTRPASWTGSSSWLFNPTNNHFAGTSGAGGNLPTPAAGKQMLSIDLNGSNLTRTVTYAGTTLGTYESSATYTLTVAGGQRLDQAVWGYNRYTVSLLVRDNSTSPWVVVTSSPTVQLTAAGTFVDVTGIHTATTAIAGKEIGIRVTVTGSWSQGQVDNVRLIKVAGAAAPMLMNGDVGAPYITGLATVSTSAIRRSGQDVWNTGDQVDRHRPTVRGDGMRVTGPSNMRAGSKAGVMFRDSSVAHSAVAKIGVHPGEFRITIDEIMVYRFL